MHPRLLLALGALACGPAPDDDDDDGSDVPLLGDGTDGADGTDASDGADGSDGTDGGTGLTGSCDTGTEADLVFGVLVADATGPCTVCEPRSLEISAAVYNPCDEDLTFWTRSTCLYTTVEMEGPYGEGMGMGVACGDAETEWGVGGGDTYAEIVWRSGLEPGDWTASIQFDDPARTTATASFEVYGSGGGSDGSGGGGSTGSGGGDPDPEPGG